MRLFMYSIKDAKTGYMTPVVEQNDASALRNFSSAVNQPGSLLHDHPNDFALYRIGEFDTDEGFASCIPSLVADAAEVLRNER